MTVQELIYELMKIEDKSMTAFIANEDYLLIQPKIVEVETQSFDGVKIDIAIISR